METTSSDWLHDLTEVTLTVQDVANRLHQDMYGPQSEHRAIHSCPCFIEARWFLGLDDKPKMYWPDGNGGNAHEPSPNPLIEYLRLKDVVIEACRARHDAESERSDASYRGSKCVDEDVAMQQSNCDLREAMCALLEFEKEHSK